MNEWITIAVLAVLVYLQIKLLKGILKIFMWIFIISFALLVSNYAVLPHLGLKPLPLGLATLFQFHFLH